MDVVRFGLGLRALRRRRGLTQQQLASRSRVSRAVVWRIERGSADRVAVHTLVEVAAALGARVDLRLHWQGEGLDRLLDARHASLVEDMIALLDSSGWNAAAEVSFNVRGERGSIDVPDVQLARSWRAGGWIGPLLGRGWPRIESGPQFPCGPICLSAGGLDLPITGRRPASHSPQRRSIP